MVHTLHVREVVRWTEFNEYEGEVHGELDEVPVACYVLAAPVEQWDRYRPGATLEVDAWVERSGEVETLPAGSPAELVQVDGVVYDIAGVITKRDGEQLQVESRLSIRIDLDLSARSEPPELCIGNLVRVRGMLKVDLPDEAAGEVTENQAQAHLRGEVKRVAAAVVDELARALDATGKQPHNLKQLPERLGLARGGPEAEAALRDLAVDVEAILGAVASGQPTDLDAVRERLETRGLNLGETFGHLQRELERIRHFNQKGVPNAAVSGLRAVADSIRGDSGQPSGRRIDELIAHLEREVGRYAGQDPEQNRKRRQEEYRHHARSAIADSLREAGIQPLNDPPEETR